MTNVVFVYTWAANERSKTMCKCVAESLWVMGEVNGGGEKKK